MMNISQLINNEEHFAYLVSMGKSKSEAYRTVFPEYKGLSSNLIAMRAWRYSNTPEVLRILSNEEDNLFVKYSQARFLALDILLDLAQNASSEKVQADSCVAILNQTSKLKKLEVQFDSNVKNEFADALTDLRSVLLTTTSPQHADTSLTHQQLEEVPELRLNGVALTLEMLDEQEIHSINPLKPQDGENRIRARNGMFVSYAEAREILKA